MVLNPQPNQIEMDYAPFLFELNKNRFLNSEIEFETNLFIKLASFSLIVSQNSQIQNSVQFIPVEHLPPNFVNNSDIILGIQDLIQEIHEMDSKLAMIQYVRLARPGTKNPKKRLKIVFSKNGGSLLFSRSNSTIFLFVLSLFSFSVSFISQTSFPFL